MGKYLRKAKITGDVAVMEATTLGVRTRARTLALQRLQSSSSPSPSPSPPPSSASDSCYLQLRSRRLQKSTPLPHPHSTEVSKEHPESNRGRVTEYVNDFGAEISFGGNTLDFERSDSTRESTPCSVVREADAMVNPGSATRLADSSATAQITRNSILSNIPSAHEIEEFFTFAEQQQQRLFMEKYNFDVANDLPLSGQYEWIRVNH
ncbi:hypothetical protein CQW23_21722 [Capsicum baccatum]|uniref:Cyclin-dependent kinase inhibitor n=1 Tax=Capsicum baccatum TaxID=33114 RepID=A0A2G2VYX1_CAPBA|nr:hypothetical protein CQW23_21722 [Capsicum baccatum]